MYLPSFPNLISEIEAIISVKKDLEPGASCSSNLHPSGISHEFSGLQGILIVICRIRRNYRFLKPVEALTI